MALTFTRATKKALKARIALEGPSGSGKTYTALITARALGNKIALIDTERRSASLYADLFEFDSLELDDNFHPERLIDALAAAAAGGYDVVIVDSWSHFWMGQGGMLEAVDAAGKRSGGGNNFAGWKEMRPVERRMVDAMLAYPGHLLTTLRVKTEYVVEQNAKGKQAPKKVGLRAEQREGLEYEFTLVAAMDLDNTLVVSKSRCPALSGAVVNRPTEEFGRTLLAWLDDGESLGATAVQLRDEVLAAPGATVDELRGWHARAKASGLLGAAIVDEHGDTTTLGDWLTARGRALAAPRPAEKAPAPAPVTPAEAEQAAPAERPVTQTQHRRMHALWNALGYQGTNNRDQRLTITRGLIGRDITTSANLTEAEADTVIAALEERKAKQPPLPAEEPPPAEAPMTAEQRTRLFAALKTAGLADKDDILARINEAIAPATVGSSKELSEFQAAQAIAAIEALPVPA